VVRHAAPKSKSGNDIHFTLSAQDSGATFLKSGPAGAVAVVVAAVAKPSVRNGTVCFIYAPNML